MVSVLQPLLLLSSGTAAPSAPSIPFPSVETAWGNSAPYCTSGEVFSGGCPPAPWETESWLMVHSCLLSHSSKAIKNNDIKLQAPHWSQWYSAQGLRAQSKLCLGWQQDLLCHPQVQVSWRRVRVCFTNSSLPFRALGAGSTGLVSLSEPSALCSLQGTEYLVRRGNVYLQEKQDQVRTCSYFPPRPVPAADHRSWPPAQSYFFSPPPPLRTD